MSIQLSFFKIALKLFMELLSIDGVTEVVIDELLGEGAEIYGYFKRKTGAQIKRLIKKELSKEKMIEMHIPKERIYYLRQEIADMLDAVQISPMLLKMYRNNTSEFAFFVVSEFEKENKQYESGERKYIEYILCGVLPKLMDILICNPQFLTDGLVMLANTTEQLKIELDDVRKQIVQACNTFKTEYFEYISDRPFDVTEAFEGRSLLTDQVAQKIMQGQSIVLAGVGGIGKSEVAKAVIKKIENQKCEVHGIEKIAWIDYDNTNIQYCIARSLVETRNIDKIDIAWNKALNIIEQLRERLLIVVDNIEDAEADENLCKLADLPCRLLLTSRTDRISSFETIEVEELQLEDCARLFCHYYTKKPCPPHLVNNIVTLADCHTVTIELLAKIAQLEEKSLQEFNDHLILLGFHVSQEEVSAGQNKLRKEAIIIKQLAKLFSVQKMEESEKNLIIPVSVIPSLPFNFSQAKRWFSQGNRKILEKFSRTGWLKITYKEDAKYYIMHSVIASAVRYQFSEELYSRCKGFIGELTKELQYDEDVHGSDKTEIIQFSWSINDLLKNYLEDEKDGSFLYFLSRIYLDIANYHKAFELLRHSVRIFRKDWKNNVVKIIASYNLIGLVYKGLCFYRKALTQYKKAIILAEKYELPRKDWITILTNTGLVFMHLEGISSHGYAAAYLENACKLAEKEFGIDGKETLRIKFYYGNCIAEKDPQRASDEFEYVIEKQKELYGNTHFRVAESYASYGNFLFDYGKYALAEEMLENALEIKKQLNLDMNHPDIADIENTLGLVKSRSGLYEEAGTLFQSYLEKSIVIYGENSPVIAAAYCNMGLNKFDMENYEEALDLFKKAEMLLRGFEQVMYNDLVNVLTNQAQCYCQLQNYDQAIDQCKEALSIYSQNPNKSGDGIAEIFEALGSAYAYKGWITDAYKSFERALSEAIQYWGQEHSRLASIYFNYGVLLEENNELLEAKGKMESAYRILNAEFGNNHENVEIVRMALEELNKKLNE